MKVKKMNNHISRIGLIEMVTAMIIMGTVGIFVVESGQNAYDVVFFRCVFGSCFLALYCYLRGLFKNTGLTRNTLLLAIASGVFLVFNWVLLFASFRISSISISTTIYHTQPFFFLLIGSIVFREKITLEMFAWMVLAFTGVALISDISISSLSMSFDQIRGVIYTLTAALLWAVTAVIVKRLSSIKPHLVALIQVFVGIFVLYPFATLETIGGNTQAIQWGYLVALGAFHTCLTYILMYSAFQKLQTATISILTFIYPAVAILADFLIYDESFTYLQAAGVVFILFSSFAISSSKDKKKASNLEHSKTEQGKS